MGELLRLGEAGVGAGELSSCRAALGEDRTEEEQADRKPAGEPLHDLCDFRCASLADGSRAADRPRDGQDGDDEAADHRAELVKTESRPDEEREDQVWIAPEATEEDDCGDRDQEYEQQPAFDQSLPVELPPRPLRENQQQRRHDEVPHGVAEPPEEPCRPVVGRIDVAREEEGRGAVRRCDGRARDRSQPDQREHIAHAVERRPEVDP